MSSAYLSIIIIVTSSLIFILLERIKPYNPQKILRDGFFLDLIFYTFIQNYVLSIIIFDFLINPLNKSLLIYELNIFKNYPVWLQLTIFTISHDFYIYWMHRWQHKNKYLWRIHEAHHSPKNVDWLSGSRSHPIEILINQTIEFLPIVILSGDIKVIAFKGVISAVWGMFIHSNLKVDLGLFNRIINSPILHRWHHSPAKANRNFSTKLSIWDYMFNSIYYEKDIYSPKYGLYSYFPDNYFSQFLYAFRTFNKRKTK